MRSSGSDAVILGIDLGTGGAKVVLASARRGVLRQSQRHIGTTRPAPGFSEQHPRDWLAAVAACCREVLADGEIPVAIGISGAAHIPVFLNSALEIVRPSILWNDTRSAAIATRLSETHGAEILALTCNMPSPAWTLPMLVWLEQNEPETLGATRHLLLGKDLLVHALTGVLVTDHGNAVSSMLADAHQPGWAAQLQDLVALDAAAYPEIVDPAQIVGGVTADAAERFGLPAGTPVIAGLLDSLGELIALGATRPGNSMLRLGTAGGIMTVTEQPLVDARLITYPFVGGQWASQAFTSSCASAISWFQGVLSHEPAGASSGLTFEAMDLLAAAAEPGASGLLFQPYLAGERVPHWDSSLRAGFVGAGFEHKREHMVRAIFEGVGCSIADCHDAIASAGADTGQLRATGGGTRSDVLLSIVANILGKELSLGPSDGSATGAAALAGVSAGVFDNLDAAISAFSGPARSVMPRTDHTQLYRAVLQRYRALSTVLNPFYRQFPFQPIAATP